MAGHSGLIPLRKEDIRKNIGKMIADIPKEVLEKKGRLLSMNLRNFFRRPPEIFLSSIQRTNVLGGFVPLKDEIDWTSVLPFEGMMLAFPVEGQGGQPAFLLEGSENTFQTPDTLLVPGRAFGVCGERLGRGGGFYDRYLETFEGLKIGLSFEEQIFDGVPMEDHDVFMDCIITDKRVLSPVEER